MRGRHASDWLLLTPRGTLMPELPEVETVRRGLEPAMVGATFLAVTLRRPDLRFPFPDRFAERLTGARVTALARRAKFLAAALSTGETLIMHLGMSGRFIVEAPGTPPTEPGSYYNEIGRHLIHDHVVFEMGTGARVTHNDVRRFGFMDLVPRAELATSRHLGGMGIEPLGNELSGAALAQLFAGRRTSLKAALMDQGAIAGLGNIYVCEALHRAGLSPQRAAGTLVTKGGAPTVLLERLVPVIREVIAEAIEAGGSSLRDHAQPSGELGYFQHSFHVYDREGEACRRCGDRHIVRRIVQSGRSTFYCPACQR